MEHSGSIQNGYYIKFDILSFQQMSLKLHTPASHIVAGSKVEVFLKMVKIPVEMVRIPMTDTKKPDYLAINPFGKVPALETPEGPIFESLAILRYLARKAGKMYGTTVAETASIDQWLEFHNTQVQPNLMRIAHSIFGYSETTKEQYDFARKEVLEALKSADAHLKTNQFFGSKELSIADIAIATQLRYVFRLVFDETIRKEIPNVTRWFLEVANVAEFKEHFGKTWLCQKEFTPDFTFWDYMKGKKAEEEKKKKEEEKLKKEEEKKKKEEKKKAEEEADKEPEEGAAEKKKQNPLDLLPKSPFNIDDWKRKFCNIEDKKGCLQQLWADFDLEGWSVWKSHYIRYEGEGDKGYLTSNLKNGFLRNLDTFRKYTFAVLGVYGVEGNFEIEGAWMWRGTEIPEEWKEHQSYDYFTFTKLNPKDENDQKLIESYWLNLEEGQEVEGRPLFDAKWFK